MKRWVLLLLLAGCDQPEPFTKFRCEFALPTDSPGEIVVSENCLEVDVVRFDSRSGAIRRERWKEEAR